MLCSPSVVFASMTRDSVRQNAIDEALALAEGGNVSRYLAGTGESDLKTSEVERRHKIEFAFQMAHYLLKMDDKWPYYYSQSHSEDDRVEKKGALYGFFGSYTWNLFEPLTAWSDIWKNNPWPNFVRVEGEAAYGGIDYSSSATGKKRGFNAWELDARFLFGYDYAWGVSTLFTPYIGFGYQRFTDDAGGWIDPLLKGYAAFTKKTSFYYVPVGVETLTALNKEWDLGIKLEGDLVIGGTVESYYSEIHTSFSGYEDVETEVPLLLEMRNTKSDFNSGLGIRAAVKLVRKFQQFDLFAEPYFRYLILQKSDPESPDAYDLYTGKDYNLVDSRDKSTWDPKNQTINAGLRMGVQF